MKIHVKCRVYGAADRFRMRSFDAQAEPCCDRMTEAWGQIVEIGLHGFPAINNLRPMLLTATYPLADGEVVSAAMPISHCPWCGSLIELVDGGIDPAGDVPVAPKLAVEVEEINF